jgi:signal transduction histidine kinase
MLAEYIDNHVVQLSSAWTQFARASVPAAQSLDAQTIREGSEAILRAIAAAMRNLRSDSSQIPRSSVSLTSYVPYLAVAAQGHAAERVRAGFTIDELVSEYHALRTSVVQAWVSDPNPAYSHSVDQLISFDEATDQSLIEAVRWFNQKVEYARDLFTAILSHDLRSPLNGAVSAVELAKLCDDNRDARLRANLSADRCLRSMIRMIDTLLDFTRTRLGDLLPIDPSESDMQKICSELLEEVGAANPDHPFDLRCDRSITGVWDVERIRQMLSNLIRNAVAYGKRGSTITLKAHSENGEVVLSVHNEGRPIPKKKHAIIFDPLIRGEMVKQGERREADSLGLGLYIVRQIVLAHRGTIELTSNATEGTTFTVRLPRVGN